MSDWREVSKASPCPVCGKPDWCAWTPDGWSTCKRGTDPPQGMVLVKLIEGGGLFRPASNQSRDRRSTRRASAKSKSDEKPEHYWLALAQRFAERLTDNQLQELAEALGVTPAALRSVGVGWTGRVWTFTERDGAGRVIGIATRRPNGSKGFLKGGKRGLTVPNSLDELTGPVLGVEGPSDVAACLTVGLAAVGRPSNCGGVEHLAELLGDREIIVVGENDQKIKDGTERWPGSDGARSVAKRLAEHWGKPIPWALVPYGVKDVREWLKVRHVDLSDRAACEAAGHELLDKLVGTSEWASPVRLRVECTPGRVKVKVTAELCGEAIAVEMLNLASSKARAAFVKAVAEKSPDIDEKALQAELLHLAADLQPAAVQADRADPEGSRSRDDLMAEHDEQVERALAETTAEVIEAAESILADPGLVDRILDAVAVLGVVGERVLALMIYLVGVSRLLPNPLAAIVQGLSATGKTYVVEGVARLFPGESTLIATDITPQALYYLRPGSLIHRFVVAGERSRIQDDDQAEARRALRQMLSDGELSKALPIKVDGRIETVVIRQHGPISYVESTTLTRIFDEDANRCLMMSTDESKAQTERIVMAITERAQRDASDPTRIIAVHHALQRMLRRVRVVIPFADRLGGRMPTSRPEARRAIGHVLDLIRAVAVLHQRQRAGGPVEHGDKIEATIADYVVARRLLIGPLARALGGALPDAVANLGQRLADRYGEQTFTTTQAAQDDPMIKSRNKMVEYLGTLIDTGVVDLVEAGKGNKPHTWRVIDGVPDGGARWLPTADELEPSLCTTA